jgi:hypothetical protein
MAVHKFDEFELRMAGPENLELATRWTNADPDHAGRVKPEFWIEQSRRAESWLLRDRLGPIFFFKAVKLEGNILEVHVQFAPPPPAGFAEWEQIRHRSRISRALIRGMQWLEQRVSGFEEIRFESQSPLLIHFCQNHLGFSRRGKLLYKRLSIQV